MRIAPSEIATDGPGVDLSNLPNGLASTMADEQKDFVYSRNAVTLIYDLSEWSQIRLSFKAMEFGDEPPAPPSNPFTGEANFDGVAVSNDDITWYEIQDLRHLRSDRFRAFDITPDAPT